MRDSRELFHMDVVVIGVTYSVKQDCDCTIGIQGSLVATELGYLAYEQDMATNEAVQVWRCDAGRG